MRVSLKVVFWTMPRTVCPPGVLCGFKTSGSSLTARMPAASIDASAKSETEPWTSEPVHLTLDERNKKAYRPSENPAFIHSALGDRFGLDQSNISRTFKGENERRKREGLPSITLASYNKGVQVMTAKRAET